MQPVSRQARIQRLFEQLWATLDALGQELDRQAANAPCRPKGRKYGKATPAAISITGLTNKDRSK